MRASRVESGPSRHNLRALSAISLLLLVAGPAIAQTGAPIPLLLPPANPAAAAPPAAAPATAPDNGISTESLAPIDAAWVGTLGAEAGALPQTLWQGTARGFVGTALLQLAPSTSAGLQDLARRLLQSNAAAPGGNDPADRPSLAAIRLDRIVALGEVADGLKLMDLLPAEANGDSLERSKVELRIASGDVTGACANVQQLVARYPNLWWRRALVACQALAGNGAGAALGQSLLHEQKAPPDPVFDLLIEVLGGRPHKLEKLPEPTPLRVALWAATKRPLPAEALAQAGPAALLAYVASNGPTPLAKLAPAERAAQFGALPADRLAELCQSVAFRPEDQVAALKGGKLPEDAKSRAILIDVARSGAADETRQAAVAALLVEAAKRDAFALTAELVLPALTALHPQGADADFAGSVARALLVTGHADAAAPWIALAGTPELALLAHLAAPAAGADSAALLHDAVAALASRSAAAAPLQGALLVATLAGFDEKLGSLDWSPLLAPPHETKVPDATWWVAGQEAIAAKQVGALVLTTLLTVGIDGRLSTEPILVGRAVAALRAAGLEHEARALALEAALDAGI